MKKIIISGLAAAMALASSCSKPENGFMTTEDLGVCVTAEENREYSYTDKKAGWVRRRLC